MKTDIAIVGGGPAGAYLGYCLAKKGIKAVIFDDSHPREKPCGGGISSFALRKFPILKNIPKSKRIAKKITDMYLNWILGLSSRTDKMERFDFCDGVRCGSEFIANSFTKKHIQCFFKYIFT